MPDTVEQPDVFGGGWTAADEWYSDAERAAAEDLPRELARELDRRHFNEWLKVFDFGRGRTERPYPLQPAERTRL